VDIPEERPCERFASEKEEKPPFLGSWNRLYISIVIYTCALVLVLFLMTITLNR
jgi:hypothetical protein